MERQVILLSLTSSLEEWCEVGRQAILLPLIYSPEDLWGDGRTGNATLSYLLPGGLGFNALFKKGALRKSTLNIC